MERLRLAVIGVGHLGKEHARILAGLPGVELVGVVDARPAQARDVAQRCGARAFTDHYPLLDQVDAAVVAVPTVQHHTVAADFLARGVSLLVEKPLAASLEEADELVALAQHRGALLQVGHIERYNPAFEELLRRPLQPKLVCCQRLSPFSGRSLDIGVVLDLMIHDLDMLLTLVAAPVREVSALGLSLLSGQEDMAQARLTFANGCVAHLSASRVHTSPVRQMELWAPEGYVAADFHQRRLTLVQPSEDLRRATAVGNALCGVPGGTPQRAFPTAVPQAAFGHYLEKSELDCNVSGPDQLTRELEEFIAAVRTGVPVRVTGEQGRAALALAGRVVESLRAHQWDGEAGGPAGPLDPPAPLGRLFTTPGHGAAA